MDSPDNSASLTDASMGEEDEIRRDVQQKMNSDGAQLLYWRNRLKTFQQRKWPWPFVSRASAEEATQQTRICTAELMARAGFVHIPTDTSPDGVSCVVCFKELDGWEENDDPWEEHKSHSAECYLVQLDNKEEEDWTVEEFLTLLAHRNASLTVPKIEEFLKQHAERGTLTVSQLLTAKEKKKRK